MAKCGCLIRTRRRLTAILLRRLAAVFKVAEGVAEELPNDLAPEITLRWKLGDRQLEHLE